MLQPSPEHQKGLDEHLVDPIQEKALRLEQRRFKRHQRLNRGLAVAALLGIGISSYAADVWSNQQLQANASIAVQVEGPPLNAVNKHKGLVFVDGFNTYDANILAKYMGKAIQPVIDGTLLSVNYNNAPLETSTIAARIIEAAKKEKIDTLSLVGYSAGGDVVMQVQDEIHRTSNLDIQSDILISTPNGAEALRPARQDEVNLVQQFSWIPGIAYSTPLRFIGEMAFRADRYNSGTLPDNIHNFFTTAQQVTTDMDTKTFPGTWLMFDQMIAIENADLKARFATIEKLPDSKTKPTVIYMGTAKPGYDYMIDDKKSARDIARYAKEAGVPFLSYDVPGAVHTRPDLANEAYIKTFTNAKHAIQTSIHSQEYLAHLNRLASIASAREAAPLLPSSPLTSTDEPQSQLLSPPSTPKP